MTYLQTLILLSIVSHIGLIIVNAMVSTRKNLKDHYSVVLLSLFFAPLVYLYVLAAPANEPDSSKK